MKEVNLVNLKDAANRLLFDMSDSEYQTLLVEFETVKKQMEIIASDKSVESYSPMTFPFSCISNTLREDVASKPISRELALKNAKKYIIYQLFYILVIQRLPVYHINTK